MALSSFSIGGMYTCQNSLSQDKNCEWLLNKKYSPRFADLIMILSCPTQTTLQYKCMLLYLITSENVFLSQTIMQDLNEMQQHDLITISKGDLMFINMNFLSQIQ